VHNKFLHRFMIGAAIAATHSAHTMMLAPTFFQQKQKPEKLFFKTTADISNITRGDCAGAGFILGFAQQYAAFNLTLESKSAVEPFCKFMQWPMSLLAAYCVKGYHENIAQELQAQKECAISALFARMPRSSVTRDAFIEQYKQMRAGDRPLTADVVSVHNNTIERSVAWSSFSQGYMFGASAGPLPALLIYCLILHPKP
jgi:hypothetical protein